MRSLLPALLLLSPAFSALGAEGSGASDSIKKTPESSALSMLPDGSKLKNVNLPRFDAAHQIVGILKAKLMTRINADTIHGDAVILYFFNDDHTPRGRVDMVQAMLYQSKDMVETRDFVTLRSDDICANGSGGMTYMIKQGRGFLIGPVLSWMHMKPKEGEKAQGGEEKPDLKKQESENTKETKETSMNSTSSPLQKVGIAGMSLIAAQSLATATVPPAPSAEEKAKIQAEAAPTAEQHAAEGQETRTMLKTDLERSNAANAVVKEFLEQTNMSDTQTVGSPPALVEMKPLEVHPLPTDTVITCDGGVYFDPDKGMFVYLKNVKVNDPRYTMTGANELKIFLSKKEKKPKDASAPKEEKKEEGTEKPKEKGAMGGMGDKFGEVEHIVATGVLLINEKPTDPTKAPIRASGTVFTYNLKTDDMILTGGYPWVVQGGMSLRAMQPNLLLRIHPNTNSFSTQGPWDSILPTNQTQDKKKPDGAAPAAKPTAGKKPAAGRQKPKP